jgi:hypothetical protein
MAASKTYDGGAAAAIEGGGLMGVLSGDTVTLNTSGASGTFASKNVGQDITVWVGGLTLGGPQASDYWFETPTTWANITAAPITITPTYNSKTYDGTTSAAATPTITSGTLVGSDTVTGLSETYYSKNAYADAELSVAPGYTVNDGNGGHNYAVTLAYATGSIAARAITVTAATSSKLYDGTTSSTATPTITGTLASGDTAAFTETFTNKNAGTGKTLTVGGSVNDGDGGNNYAVNVVTNTAGSITARAITVTAASTWKTYDGTTSAGATPTITGGSLVSGDSADFGESFASRNAGASVTLTPIGCINDGNGGNNYAVTWADASGVIQPATLWVAAVPNTKAYDGTTSAAAAPTITGTIFGGDTAAFTETFTTKNAGTGKTLNPAGSVNDGNGGNNYTVSFLATGGGAINPTGLTITAAANTKAYDGTTSAAAIPTVTGLQGNDTVTGLAEAYTDPSLGTGKTLNVTGYYICDGNEGANYAVSLVSNTTGAIVTPTTTTVNSSEASAPYGDPVTFTATVTAQSGSIAPAGSVEFYDSTTSTDLGDSTTPASSNGTTSTWTLATTAKTLNATSGDTIVAIYTGTGFGGSSGATTETVTALSITVTAVGSTKDYDGTNASAGVPTISCGSLVSGDTAAFAETYNTQDIGTGLTLTPGGTVNDGNGGNDYTVTFVSDTTGAICQAVPTVAVVDAGGGYDGSGFPATASVAGVVDGVDTTPAATLEGVSPTLTYYAGDDTSGDVLPSAPSAPGIYTVVASFAGSTDYAPAESDPVTFTINPSSPTIMGATIVDGSEVDLTWNDVPTSVSGYSIQQLMADGVTWQEVQTAGANASSAVVIGNFDPPGQYTFQVVAYQEMDEPDDTYELDSQASNQATVTALAWPSSPTGLTATPVSNSEIDLAWTDNATNATSCEVDRTTDGQTWTTVATLDPGATSYNDTGLTDGTMYAYRVRAINSVGGSGYAVNGTSTLPTAPGNLDGTAVSGTEIDLSWTAAAYATGYTISMQEEGSDTWDVIGTVPATQTTFAATGLAPGGTEYAFCVAPTNSTSESAVAYIDLMTVNQAPTFATAPSAGADPVTTTNTTLSVLGADDGGESNLTYSWSIVASPYDGGAYFSVNDSNAAKNTIVTFYAAGDYILQVAATDALGAEADACVDVTVQQTLTGVTVTPNDDAILTGGSTQFTATALDQFGNAMTPQPPFTWSTPPVGTLVPSTGDTAVATYTAPTTGGSTTAQVSAYSGGMTTAANVAVIATPAAADDWVEDVVASVGSNSVDSPYNVTLTGPATFTFHDFSQGNVFRIYDNGALILTTTLVGGYAYGQAMLAAGSHALTVNWASQGQPGNGDECAYRINQEALLALTVSDDSSGDTATAITDGVAETLTVPGVPSASDPTTLTATVCIDPGITQDTDTNRVYLSIEDKNESGQTNQTLYYGPLSQLSAADCTLTTNAQTVDFVILEWVDGKGDGQLDAGDDSREVGVKVVTPWSAVGTWTAGQKCMVQANADGASLAQLAYDITGGESDAGALGNIGQIKRGQQIDVTPLLNLLDSRVRAQIVAATEGQSVQNLSNNVGFGYGPNPTGFALVDLNGETINELFDSVTPGSLSPTPHYKCDGMIEVIYARGLMLGAGLSAGQFDRLNVNVALIQNVYCKERTGIPETQLKPGDWANLMNAPGCWNGMWKNENVIVIDPGNVGWGLQADSTYFGWPIGTQSYSHWLETLAEEYDKPIPWWDLWSTVNSDEVPGYVGQSWWLNIPMLGQKIFNMRTGATP